MDLVTDIETIRKLSEERSDENLRFRYYVKTKLKWSDDRVDNLVHEIWREVSQKIDCTVCANCCKTMGLTYNDEDVARLSRRLGITVPAFEARYVVRDEFGERVASDIPCPFLEGSLCSIYEDRPADCRGFPHLHKENFRSRMKNTIEIADECPIAFNVLEELKIRLGLKYLHRSGTLSHHTQPR
jgi:Fe-S-cluster containining protein